jgi:hypothetical protein
MSDFEARTRAAFDAVNQRQLAAIDVYMALYHDDVYFEDPMQRLYGKVALTEGLRRMLTRLRDVEFQIHTLRQIDNEAYLTWTMRFRPPIGPGMCVEGSSHLRLHEGLIHYHRDYWDMLSSLAETSPLLGLAYRAVMRRLA